MGIVHKLKLPKADPVVITTIDEPVGFDGLQTTLKRHDYHGIGAESTLDKLEFYGQAANIIADAYAADIDSTVVYEVYSDDVLIYSGQLDLSTYNEKRGDYRSVSVKAGEIGVKTTFNNRTDKDIDLNTPKTIDGEDVTVPTWLSLRIPPKHLLYTDKSVRKSDLVVTQSGGNHGYQETGVFVATYAPYLFLPIGEDPQVEFGQFAEANPYSAESTDDVEPQYISEEDHITKYGPDTVAKLDIELKATIERKGTGWSPYTPGGYIRWYLEAVDGEGYTARGAEKKVLQSEVNFGGATWDLSCELHAPRFHAAGPVKYYLVFAIDMPSGGQSRYFYSHITIQEGSYVKMTMYDNLEEKVVNADMIYVLNALETVTSAISENALAVNSDWYRLPGEQSPGYGGGAQKVLTNGYKIRGLFSKGETKRNMPLSFKSLIESLDAIDCIGWGFCNESGGVCLRIERWDWFYKSNILLTLKNVDEISTEVLTDRIPTELKIGYKKFATQDQYNSIESPHGTRTFVNGIKAVSKALTKESEFVADNYAIEETRRAKTQKNDTEETTYDENIFIFELDDNGEIAHSAINAENVGRESEFINAKLTPRHMAARWRDYIFATNNTTPFRFTSGEINYNASFEVDPSGLESFAITSPQKEDEDITHTPAKFKAEKKSFTYPLSIEQYKSVLADPYGIVRLTDDDDNVISEGWILDFKYNLSEGTADFTLIAKNNNYA